MPARPSCAAPGYSHQSASCPSACPHLPSCHPATASVLSPLPLPLLFLARPLPPPDCLDVLVGVASATCLARLIAASLSLGWGSRGGQGRADFVRAWWGSRGGQGRAEGVRAWWGSGGCMCAWGLVKVPEWVPVPQTYNYYGCGRCSIVVGAVFLPPQGRCMACLPTL